MYIACQSDEKQNPYEQPVPGVKHAVKLPLQSWSRPKCRLSSIPAMTLPYHRGFVCLHNRSLILASDWGEMISCSWHWFTHLLSSCKETLALLDLLQSCRQVILGVSHHVDDSLIQELSKGLQSLGLFRNKEFQLFNWESGSVCSLHRGHHHLKGVASPHAG